MVQAGPEKGRRSDRASQHKALSHGGASVNGGSEPTVTWPRVSPGGSEVASVQALWSQMCPPPPSPGALGR